MPDESNNSAVCSDGSKLFFTRSPLFLSFISRNFAKGVVPSKPSPNTIMFALGRFSFVLSTVSSADSDTNIIFG